MEQRVQHELHGGPLPEPDHQHERRIDRQHRRAGQPGAEGEGLRDWFHRLPKDAAVEARIERILAKMSLEEKVGQIIQADISSATPDDVKKVVEQTLATYGRIDVVVANAGISVGIDTTW